MAHEGSTDHSGCRLPSRSQAHCSVCHRTFAGVTGFDKHRKSGQCLDPGEIGYIEKDRIWRKVSSSRPPAHWSARKGEPVGRDTPEPVEAF